jgi:hypothetical protein
MLIINLAVYDAVYGKQVTKLGEAYENTPREMLYASVNHTAGTLAETGQHKGKFVEVIDENSAIIFFIELDAIITEQGIGQ